MRIAIISNTSWYLYNFRLNLMHALMAGGHEVVAVGPPDDYVTKLAATGIRHRAFPLAGASVNPLRELRTVWALHRIFRGEGIEVALSYTPKGNIYAAMAAAMNGVPTVPNISGLGRVFIRHSALTWLVKQLYRFALGRAARVFFENRDDLELFVRLRLVDVDKAVRLPGSGVDLERFRPRVRANASDEVRFLLSSRLLWDKGLAEYVEAARRLKSEYGNVKCRLLGFLNVANPSAVPREEVNRWHREGIVEYLGSTDDAIPHLADVDCVVLPSYREGMPRSLLEAAAMGLPVITTDAPGCRDAVEDGLTGYICKPCSADDLTEKMRRMAELSKEQRQAMGAAGREKMIREFDERIVLQKYAEALAAVRGATNQVGATRA